MSSPCGWQHPTGDDTPALAARRPHRTAPALRPQAAVLPVRRPRRPVPVPHRGAPHRRRRRRFGRGARRPRRRCAGRRHRAPRNAFPFAAEASVLLIAGGIGITPILPMAREAARRGLDWRLVHTGRSRGSMPFAAELAELAAAAPGRVSIRPDDESGVPEAADLLSSIPAAGAVYCCGPAPMIDGVRRAFGGSRASALHFERFAPAPITDGRPFELQLGDTGRVLPVPYDRSALDVLHEALPDLPFSCRQGFCGTCRVRVAHGHVDHRDRRLTAAERAAGAMLPCVSRAPEGERLVLEV